MSHWYRLALAAGMTAALTASVACGGSGGGATATPAAATSTPVVATSTVAATATSTSGVASATQPTAVAPSATAAPQQSVATPSLPTALRATPTMAAPPPPPAEQSLTVVAKDVKFVQNSLTARAGGVLHLTLDNQDPGVPHDIIVYDAAGAIAGATEPTDGPVQQTLTVTLGAPGRYTFKCSVHPQTMNGTIAVQ